MIDDKLLDLSNHDDSTFNAACFYQEGVRRVIIAGDRTTARSQIQRAQAAGLKVVGLYAYLYWGRDPWGASPLARTNAAIRLAKDFGIGWVWLDVEHTEGGNPLTRGEELRACVKAVEDAGLRAGIYTGSWYWPNYMGNTTEFSHLPLWHAAYGVNNAPRSPLRTVNYGGWNTIAIHQYTSAKQLCGRVRDFNYMFIDLDESEEEDMTPEQVKALIEEMVGPRLARLERLDEYLSERLPAISRATDLSTSLDALKAMNSVQNGGRK